ncbi:hypothetical protein D3C79_430710 [compost metagenome]
MITTPMIISTSILLIGYILQWVNIFYSLASIASGIKYQRNNAGVTQVAGRIKMEDDNENLEHGRQ